MLWLTNWALVNRAMRYDQDLYLLPTLYGKSKEEQIIGSGI